MVAMLRRPVWKLFLKLRGRDFDRQYNEAKKLDIQKNVEDLLLHAYAKVPHYGILFKKINLVKNSKLDTSRFREIPILTKETIREHYKELVSEDYTLRGFFLNFSGGSTGEPLTFIQDRLCLKWTNATNKYYYENIIGVHEDSAKKVLLWGSERDIFEGSIGFKAKAFNFLTNTVFLNTFRMTEADMERYVRVINSCKPEIIRGYAGSLYEISSFIERKKISVYTPNVIVSAAETLRDDFRQKIETIFGTKVYDFYGSREVNGIAGECKNGLMHIFMFNNYVEVLDNKNQEVKQGENGKVVLTSLHNYSMPLIRFEIGDTAILGPDRCKCGNTLPTLKKVTGRITDHFIRKDGTVIHGEYFTHLFYQKDWVEAFRVIQEDYKKIRIMIVLRDKLVNEPEKRDIEEKIKLVMGKDCKVVWEVVDEIPKTKSGKYLYTESLLAR